MSELERALGMLAAELEWPPTPELVLTLEPAARRRLERRGLVLAVAVAVVAVALAFAVPQARSAILRFLHLGGVTVERVSTLPAAEQRPLAVGLGEPVTRTEAEAALGGPVALPGMRGEPQLFERGGVVSTVLATPEPVLLSELRSGEGAALLKKVAGISTGVEPARIDEATEGLWIAGEEHVVYWLDAPPRLAGNVLVWERGGVTYRLEGRTLTKARALELARDLRS
jgi:hypothetical protein